MSTELLVGALTAGATLLTGIIAVVAVRRQNAADTDKARAEADQVVLTTWRENFIEARDEATKLRNELADARGEIDTLTDNVRKLNTELEQQRTARSRAEDDARTFRKLLVDNGLLKEEA